MPKDKQRLKPKRFDLDCDLSQESAEMDEVQLSLSWSVRQNSHKIPQPTSRSFELPIDVIAWIKQRELQGALGGPVGLEWGSPDCPWE